MTDASGQRCGWKQVKRQITIVRKEIKRWPKWMKQAIKSRADVN